MSPRAPDRFSSARATPGSHHSGRTQRNEAPAFPTGKHPARETSSPEQRPAKHAHRMSSGFLNSSSFFPMPCASYQCNSASQIVPSGSRTPQEARDYVRFLEDETETRASIISTDRGGKRRSSGRWRTGNPACPAVRPRWRRRTRLMLEHVPRCSASGRARSLRGRTIDSDGLPGRSSHL